jgi:nitronate monooxygenase
MDLHTPVCDLLCCEEPIVLAGMGGVARAELVAAVSEAGGFGFLGMVREPPAVILSEIEAGRSRTRRPFGVNLIPAATQPALLEAELAVCIEAQVHAVTLFWELAPEIVRRLREVGILVLCQVGSAAEAAAAEAAGADIIIAQGWEAGGHVRGRMGLHALLANVLEVVHTPVLAAGGLVDGDDLAAVMTLGAQGAVMGTAFLATHESFAHAYHKQRIVEAGPGQTVRTDAFHINWPPGAKVRVLPNSVTRGEHGDPFAPGRQVIAHEGDRPIYLFSTDSPLRTTTGKLEAMAIYGGQGSARIMDVVPAGERLATIAAGARAALRARAPRAGQATRSSPQSASPPCYAAEAPDAYMGFAGRDELAA